MRFDVQVDPRMRVNLRPARKMWARPGRSPRMRVTATISTDTTKGRVDPLWVNRHKPAMGDRGKVDPAHAGNECSLQHQDTLRGRSPRMRGKPKKGGLLK